MIYHVFINYVNNNYYYYIFLHKNIKRALNRSENLLPVYWPTSTPHPPTPSTKRNPSIREIQQLETWIQSNLQVLPPLVSNQFSKITKVSESNHSIWNLLQATATTFRAKSLKLFFVFSNTWQIMEQRCCKIIVFLTSTRNRHFLTGKNRIFLAKLIQKNCISIGAWYKSRQFTIF